MSYRATSDRAMCRWRGTANICHLDVYGGGRVTDTTIDTNIATRLMRCARRLARSRHDAIMSDQRPAEASNDDVIKQ